MTQTIEAIYDGLVFRPDQPLQIDANTRVRIVVEEIPATSKRQTLCVSETAMLAATSGRHAPPISPTNIDHYLYGDLRRNEDSETPVSKGFLNTAYAIAGCVASDMRFMAKAVQLAYADQKPMRSQSLITTRAVLLEIGNALI